VGPGAPGGAGPPHPAGLTAAAQVFVDDLEAPVLADDDRHHLVRVLRLRPEEAVVAADGAGSWRLCRFDPGPHGAGALVVEGPVRHQPAPPAPVTVGFVPVKGERPEWVVQKLTELGVDRIVVLRSGRSIVRWEGEKEDKALDRLRRVAKEAAAQSRRARLPAVHGVWDLPLLAGAVAPEPLALAHPGGPAPGGEVRGVAVGPEGGWQAQELESGLPLVGLGPAVLRAETAAVAFGALLCALRDGLVRPA
jgi:16S rRNA (uracil1498-N3)-methyltransferase